MVPGGRPAGEDSPRRGGPEEGGRGADRKGKGRGGGTTRLYAGVKGETEGSGRKGTGGPEALSLGQRRAVEASWPSHLQGGRERGDGEGGGRGAEGEARKPPCP